MVTRLQDRVALEAGPAIGPGLAIGGPIAKRRAAVIITGDLARKAAAADEVRKWFAPSNGTKKDKVDNLSQTAPRHGGSVGIAFGTARCVPLEEVSTLDLGPYALLANDGSSFMPTESFLIDGDISVPYLRPVL
ncbi:hypothetical protein QWY28_22600 [Nocardioides sp. SOB77]|uniref:Uncharacterized protein n=1 Tax=Nocardioides oceani TaxID=3058369 RepID=A0ABT8FMB5_9ACTN|nr:hypothetical protein [Nocardioides oceani]MDN4175769.1 hypothetical protein [Nocardioides oceani]